MNRELRHYADSSVSKVLIFLNLLFVRNIKPFFKIQAFIYLLNSGPWWTPGRLPIFPTSNVTTLSRYVISFGVSSGMSLSLIFTAVRRKAPKATHKTNSLAGNSKRPCMYAYTTDYRVQTTLDVCKVDMMPKKSTKSYFQTEKKKFAFKLSNSSN